MTDLELEAAFFEWWPYPAPPGPHALMTHIGWARHLLEQVQDQQQQREQGR
jgi:hypothetical protein